MAPFDQNLKLIVFYVFQNWILLFCFDKHSVTQLGNHDNRFNFSNTDLIVPAPILTIQSVHFHE